MRDYVIGSDLKESRFEDIKFVQYDNGSTITINLFEDGQTVNLENYTVIAKFKRSDGQEYNRTTSVLENKIIATLDSTVTGAIGVLKIIFKITYDSSNKQVFTFALLADITENFGEGNSGDIGGNTGTEVNVDLSNYYKKSETYSKEEVSLQFEDIVNQIKSGNTFLQSEIPNDLKLTGSKLQLMKDTEVIGNGVTLSSEITKITPPTGYEDVDMVDLYNMLPLEGVIYVTDEYWINNDILSGLCTVSNFQVRANKNDYKSPLVTAKAIMVFNTGRYIQIKPDGSVYNIDDINTNLRTIEFYLNNASRKAGQVLTAKSDSYMWENLPDKSVQEISPTSISELLKMTAKGGIFYLLKTIKITYDNVDYNIRGLYDVRVNGSNYSLYGFNSMYQFIIDSTNNNITYFISFPTFLQNKSKTMLNEALQFNSSGELVVTINGVSKTFVPKEY